MMSKERELLRKVMESGMLDRALTTEVGQMLAQPEQEQDKKSKVDFQMLSELGLKRLQVSDSFVMQESCAKTPTLIFSENGNVVEIIKYKKLLEIGAFIDEVLNYDTKEKGKRAASKREPLIK